MNHETRIAISNMTLNEFLGDPEFVIKQFLDSDATPSRIASGWREMGRGFHRAVVADAVRHGESVPRTVRSEYGF